LHLPYASTIRHVYSNFGPPAGVSRSSLKTRGMQHMTLQRACWQWRLAQLLVRTHHITHNNMATPTQLAFKTISCRDTPSCATPALFVLMPLSPPPPLSGERTLSPEELAAKEAARLTALEKERWVGVGWMKGSRSARRLAPTTGGGSPMTCTLHYLGDDL
jgi:hypothetical protein